VKQTKCKPVKGYPEYIIYEDGRVWSNKSGKFLTELLSGNSKYPRVQLHTLNQNRVQKSIHRLIAENFIPKPKHPAFTWREWRALPHKARLVIQEEFQVDHIDGDNLNYHITNLRWVTGKENRNYYYTEQKYL